MMVFDSDPGLRLANVVHCAQVACGCGTCLSSLGEDFPRLRVKGLQIYVPLNTAVTYTRRRGLRMRCTALAERHPERWFQR